MPPDSLRAWAARLDRLGRPLVAQARTFLARGRPILLSRTARYAGFGFLFGLALTLGGYLVDFYALYHAFPKEFGFAVVQGLHAVTPVHFFTDGLALFLGAVVGFVGWLQGPLSHHST